MNTKRLLCGLFAMSSALLALTVSRAALSAPLSTEHFRTRSPEDEVIYFVLPDRFENGDRSNDRGGLRGNRLQTGLDPTHKGFYHGGDLKGLVAQLDYIEALGATAIWLAPIYKNKPVQGPPGQESAGYHGYWITDFTTVDPHFGTKEDMRRFVDAAHARGMKVYLDIIANHTADVIKYRECPENDCEYRSRADYPFTTLGDPGGAPINMGFRGVQVQTRENFAKLIRPDFAYTPYVPDAESNAKVPAWLNEPIWYQNRGNSSFRGESVLPGDFAGLDDLMTENPRVVDGFIEIYGAWIDEFGIDGFRIDTAKHVNPEFWQRFVPAMLTRARANGIPNFHVFGEVWTAELNTPLLARATRVDRLPTVLDFAFHTAMRGTLAGSEGTDQFLHLFTADALYEGGETTARRLPTFVSNHDNGRFAHYVRQAFPRVSDEEVLKRTLLAHAMIFTLRGVPVVYAGDEQGFVGDGGDQDAREDLFASKVPSYNDNALIGTDATTAQSNFDRAHPIFTEIAALSALRREHAALRRGKQLVRSYADGPGLLAVSRFDPQTGAEVLIAFNTSMNPIEQNVEVDSRSAAFSSVRGRCAPKPQAPGSYRVHLPSLGYVICAVQGHGKTSVSYSPAARGAQL